MTDKAPTFKELKESGYELALYRRWYTAKFGRALAFGSSYSTYASAVAHARTIAAKAGTTVPTVLKDAAKKAGRPIGPNATRHIQSSNTSTAA